MTRSNWLAVLVVATSILAMDVRIVCAQIAACCLGSGNCIDTNQLGCDAFEGDFLPGTSDCLSVDCAGACCEVDDMCTEGSRDECVSGDFQGAGSRCDTHCAGVLGTEFTYQGQLKRNKAPLSGMIDLEASLWTTPIGGVRVGSLLMLSEVKVSNGLFTVNLDFGADAFAGDKRWLALSVRSPHDPSNTGPFTLLSPRQPLTATPHALFSGAPWQTTGTDISYSGGNVGIGTDAPQDELDVRGDTAALRLADDRDPLSFALFEDDDFGRLMISRTNSDGPALLEIDLKPLDGTSSAIVSFFRKTNTTGFKGVNFLKGDNSNVGSARIGVGGNDSFFQLDGGNFGIGTPFPAGRLDVAGTIFQRGTSLHADYVFDPEYDLESIEEHSTFMWSQRHLPAVPRANKDAEGREVVEVGSHRRGILEELEKAHIYIERLNAEKDCLVEEALEKDRRLATVEERLARLEELVMRQSCDNYRDGR